MAIYRMLRDQRIEGERASGFAAAYELTLRALAVKDRDDPITRLIAEKIIQIGRRDVQVGNPKIPQIMALMNVYDRVTGRPARCASVTAGHFRERSGAR